MMKRRVAKKKLKTFVRRIYDWSKNHLATQWGISGKPFAGNSVITDSMGSGSTQRLFGCLHEQAERSWQKWLNRRSCGNDMSWNLFSQLLERYQLPSPQIVHKLAQ
jgi:hypothetical protein